MAVCLLGIVAALAHCVSKKKSKNGLANVGKIVEETKPKPAKVMNEKLEEPKAKSVLFVNQKVDESKPKSAKVTENKEKVSNMNQKAAESRANAENREPMKGKVEDSKQKSLKVMDIKLDFGEPKETVKKPCTEHHPYYFYEDLGECLICYQTQGPAVWDSFNALRESQGVEKPPSLRLRPSDDSRSEDSDRSTNKRE